MTKIEEIDSLVYRLNELNYNYYVNSVSVINDQDFDFYMKKLESLEKETGYIRLDSPTHRVGGYITKEFKQEIHRYPMLSLGNTYNEDELLDFDKRVRNGLIDPDSLEYVVELKFDGVAMSLIYEYGILTKAITRGDGVKGDNVTANVKTIKSIPLSLKKSFVDWDYIEIRGEVFMPLSSFEELNLKRLKDGDSLMANPRNAASGTIKLLDSSIVANRKLDFYAYQVLGNALFQNHTDSLEFLSDNNFNASPNYKICKSFNEVMDFINYWDSNRVNLPLNTDGIVVKVNSLSQRGELGFTSKSPRWAIAYKYKAESLSTILNSVDFQVGRTGNITPVANLKPILLAGTVVKRASIHNANEVERLDLHYGDTVFVEKGGEIIPKITGVDISKRNLTFEKVQFPTTCPECDTPLIRKEGEANHYCPNNKYCPPQVKGKIEHGISRKALNIENIGPETIEVLFCLGIKNVGDLFNIDYNQLIGLEGFGERSISIMKDSIEQAKKAPFNQVLYSLGIPLVGSTMSKKLALTFGNIENLISSSYAQLVALPDVGDKVANSIISYFSNQENIDYIEKLKQVPLQFSSNTVVTKESNKLEGKSFVISGVFIDFGRDELKEKIELNGGKVSSSISKKLDYFLTGEGVGPAKLEKALSLGIKMISEEDFKKML